MIKNLFYLLVLLCFGACQKPKATTATESQLQYLALGDSYTIGEQVEESKRWPVQLARQLKESGLNISEPTIIAKTGWTTGELNTAINKASLTKNYDLVSLLIGVNNQYRGLSLEEFKNEFDNLLQRSIGFVGGDFTKVFVVSIPDYGVTPFAKNRNPSKIASEIAAFNAAQKMICEKYNAAFYDITPYSKTAANQPELVANDGLHPSGRMYEGWVKIFFTDVLSQLK